MSSEKFEDLEEEIKVLYEDIRTKINTKIPKLTGEQRKSTIRDVEKKIEDANLIIEEMEDEASSAPGSYRNTMLARVRSYKRDIASAKRDLVKPSGGPHVSFGRDELINPDPMAPHRERVMQGTESINRASESIARSTRVAVETEQIGGDIIDELGDQRESLLRTRDRLHETDQGLSKTKRILNSMALRVATNKLILICIIFVELAIIAGVVYIRFIKKKTK